MRSTGISAFAYPHLVAALGLPPRRTRIEDTWQMLALPDLDVLDVLGCDVVTILDGVTNAIEQPGTWHPYEFNGRLNALVRNPGHFQVEPDATILQRSMRMVPGATVFDEPHGGQPLFLSGDLPKIDLQVVQEELRDRALRDAQIVQIRELCRRVRESTDRAVFFNDAALQPPIGIGGFGGLGIFPVLCITEPDIVGELHEIVTEHYLANIRALLPEICSNIDVIMMAADDWGTQQNLIASPEVYRKLFYPYMQQLTQACHRIAPGVKLFLHSCGAIFDLIDLIIETGYDILNPVQWTSGKNTYMDWKEKCHGRIALWGGGVDAQRILPLGSLEEIKTQVSQVVPYLSKGGGYVFCNIHNLLAEIAPEKIIAMYGVAENII